MTIDRLASRAHQLLATTVLVVLAACDRAPAPDPLRLQPADAAVVAAGRKVYEAHCAACHGMQLQGQPNWRERDSNGRLPAPPHDASGHTWHHTDEVLFRITKMGVAKAANLKDYDSGMPAYDGVLTDAQIVAALSFIKSQWPPEIRRRHDELNEAQKKRAD
ncbi:c-type cytochrome [Ramlibacter tataouinensis]|uniref:Cytochrome C n=1 Tax=Ramlibacter tataouinensis TaxID=94132 RepID=A0A127JU27_9BURK|nr:cytochrome c [Ramlibacter tataouinensis]AMO23538.1 cytochrome C [Ramlibacter tataouinensis]